MKTYKMIPYNMAQFETVEIYGLSDMHVGSKEFDEGAFNRLAREIMEQENRFVVCAGDIVDNALKNSKSNAYEAVMSPREQRAYATDLLFPIRDRILSMTGGNHEHRSTRDSDADPTEIISSKLGLEDVYHPYASFLKIDMGGKRGGIGHRSRYSVGVIHGNGGGSLIGSGLNRMGNLLPWLGVDLLISGHTHQQATAPAVVYRPHLDKNLMVARPVRVMINTGFLEYGGYPLEKGLRPAVIKPSKAILYRNEYRIDVLS